MGRRKGELNQYPQGRYDLRSFEGGKKKYLPLETCPPRDAWLAWIKAQGVASRAAVFNRDPRKVIKTTVPTKNRIFISEVLRFEELGLELITPRFYKVFFPDMNIGELNA